LTTRKRYSADLKVQAVLEVLKEQKTMSQIASDFGIHVNQLRQWREIAMENWPHTFEPQGKEVDKLRSEYEKTIEELYAQVGRLTTELTWLKKKDRQLRP
jgi:transposase-like protein